MIFPSLPILERISKSASTGSGNGATSCVGAAGRQARFEELTFQGTFLPLRSGRALPCWSGQASESQSRRRVSSSVGIEGGASHL
jgi:hypothetical protein